MALRNGMRLSQDLCDESGVLLLGAGAEITTRFLQLLHRRGIESVKTRSAPAPRSAAELHTVQTRQLDELLPRELDKHGSFRPKQGWQRPRLSVAKLWEEAAHGLEQHAATSIALAEICETLRRNPESSAQKLHSLLRDFVSLGALDADLLPLIASLHETKKDYLFDHCVNVSLLGMSMAAQLGVTRDQIPEIGLGALLQDVGMLNVPETIRLAQRPLTAEERFEIQRHPIHTLDYLEGLHGLTMAAKFIGYQVHERIDGSGYPRRRSGMFIHQFARIVAVADAYAAMVHTRPYRPPVLPYEAAKTILVEGGRGKYDGVVVRAFLDSVSLFPIGSFVELNDETRATVIRANTNLHTRPVVEEVDENDQPTGVVIDLSRATDLKVVRAVRPAETPVSRALVLP